MTCPTRHVVLVGAARSGTKILRDALADATGVGRVPYDVPFVWYQGGAYPDSDVLDPARLTPRATSRIRRYIDSYAVGTPPVVIEKTVGNTVRVPFVHAVLPEAVFVHLLRDGVDVTESTFRQWQEPVDVGYLRDKLRHTPVHVLPSYGARYVRSTVTRLRNGAAGTWGVRYPGMDEDLERDGLLRVCARQWRQSVERASADLHRLAPDHLEVRYEALVADPVATLAGVVAACGLSADDGVVEAAAARISPGTLGRGRATLNAGARAVVQDELGATLLDLGYPPADESQEIDRDGTS